jgi:hypothetical protein
MKNHNCKEEDLCICSTVALEPKENCPVHGAGEYPPRCKTCGKYIKIQNNNRTNWQHPLVDKLSMVDELPQAAYAKVQIGTFDVPSYSKQSSKERLVMSAVDKVEVKDGVYCQCEKPVRTSEKLVCSGCGKDILKVEKPSEIRSRKMKEFLKKYDEKDLRFLYFLARERPDISITAISKMNRDVNTLTVAFSFCSTKDSFCKAEGKIQCFERLEDTTHPYKTTVPWLDDGYLSVGLAFNRIEKPEKLKKIRFDSLRFRNQVEWCCC